jgi:hypothetical protein
MADLQFCKSETFNGVVCHDTGRDTGRACEARWATFASRYKL